jgi:hypothetical protein
MDLNEDSFVNTESMINDIRQTSDFKSMTFSKFKKIDVKNELMQNLLNGKIENACNWSAELICSAEFMDLWEVIIIFISKYIHIGNPKIAIYVESRYNLFKNIINNGIYTDIIQVRNDKTLRKLFAELICIVGLSKKKNSFETVKINKEDEFSIECIQNKTEATSADYALNIFKKKDPQELYAAVNEYMYCVLREDSNMLNACYWIEWIIEFDCLCKKRKSDCKCDERHYIPVEPKFKKDIIWIVWDAIKYIADNKSNKLVSKTIDSIFNLFCIKYTTSASKKRKYLLYFATSMLTEKINTNIELIQDSDKPIIKSVITNIDDIYKNIKNNEESPKTDYLFSNLVESHNNREKTMAKLNIINKSDSKMLG